MPSKTVINFPVGSFVEIDTSMNKSRVESIGTVVGVTVNHYGEPVLLVHMVTRKRGIGSLDMQGIGWKPLASDSTQTFWERTGPMHPNNVQMLQPGTILREEE